MQRIDTDLQRRENDREVRLNVGKQECICKAKVGEFFEFRATCCFIVQDIEATRRVYSSGAGVSF